MSRYFTRPRATFRGDFWGEANSTADTVHDQEPADTGILDRDGNRIYRGADEIGFVRVSDLARRPTGSEDE